MAKQKVSKDWDAFGDIEEQAKEANEEIYAKEKELNKLIWRVHCSEDGKKLFDHLAADFLNKPVCDPTLGVSKGIAVANYREGQNSVVRALLQRSQKATEEV
jgi:hypothetical protein